MAPAPTEQRDTRLLDGHKRRLALGLGLHGKVGRLTLRGDLHGQMDLLHPVTLRHAEGATTEGSGFVWAAGFTFTVQR